MTSCEECQKPLGTSPDGSAWCVNERCSKVYRAADPTPPAAPRPCECGCAERSNDARLGVVCFDCGRPVSPEAALPQRDDELCANCGYTYAGHISNTGVLYPDWKPSGRYAEAAPNLLTRVLIAEAEQWDAEHPSPLAEAAPPRATTARDWRTMSIVEIAAENPSASDYVKHWEGRCLKAEAEVDRLRASLAAHPATTPEPMTDREFIESIDSPYWRLRGAAPSRESGALLDAWGEAFATLKMFAQAYDNGQCNLANLDWAKREEEASRAAVDRHLSTLARMREAIVESEDALRVAVKNLPASDARGVVQVVRNTLRAALTPSGAQE